MEASGGTYFGQTVSVPAGQAPPSAIDAATTQAGEMQTAGIPSATAPAVVVTASRLPSPLIVVAGLLAVLYLMHR